MRRFIAAGAAVAAIISGVAADDCSSGSQDIGGNWYCSAVKNIAYAGVGWSGSYNQITSMEGGSCSSQSKSYSGAIAPLDEEVSLHFRGPLQLKQFAVYTPSSGSSKRSVGSNHRRHGHQHFHEHNKEIREIQDRAVGAEVVATMNGQVVSWVNEYAGGASATATAAASPEESSSAPSPAAAQATSSSSSSSGSSSDSGSSSSASASGSAGSFSSASSWSRQAYYESSSGTADGLVFLNHFGGSGSGVFDESFGNSLSYASSNGQSGASSPQVLSDTQLPSNTEVVIMSDSQCEEGDSCGYSRPGTVAYHGFAGAAKAFLFEFSMPDDGTSGVWTNQNMPAIWMLNAQIPRTLQYGNPECSCWTSGCGEFDIFEVLASGDTRCKSTLHPWGGDSDYFERPTGNTIKAAVVLTGDQSTAHIQILDDSQTFDTSLSSSTIQSFASQSSNSAGSSSLFQLSANA